MFIFLLLQRMNSCPLPSSSLHFWKNRIQSCSKFQLERTDSENAVEPFTRFYLTVFPTIACFSVFIMMILSLLFLDNDLSLDTDTISSGSEISISDVGLSPGKTQCAGQKPHPTCLHYAGLVVRKYVTLIELKAFLWFKESEKTAGGLLSHLLFVFMFVIILFCFKFYFISYFISNF